MIRAVIIDDERNSRDIISLMLGKYCPEVEAVSMASNCREGIEQIRLHRPQLVFLDLEMPDGTGFDVLAGAFDNTFETIFVTAFEKRFLHTIRLSEVELILKPIDKESLLQAVGNVMQRLKRNEKHDRYRILLHNFGRPANEVRQLVLPSAGPEETIVEVQDILYFEGVADGCLFTLADGRQLRSVRSFRYYTELFALMHFFQVNNTQMVQVGRISKIDASAARLQLPGDLRLDVTPRRMRELQSLWKHS
ncbi:LytR/AlgR family response regulator transcription factor [Chitinophaga lutea]